MSELKVTQPPVCPHCGETMSKFDTPPVAFSDGLGWGAPFLWICDNDNCPVFRKGFDTVFGQYGQTASMRFIVEPDTGRGSVTPSFTFDPAHMAKFLATRDRRMKEILRAHPPDDDDDWTEEDD
ncbi:MAG: hypothetical protein HY751_10040 [Nitrospinae bacterium]|nr:hypothetical protein [Nitrospinota bacterium]